MQALPAWRPGNKQIRPIAKAMTMCHQPMCDLWIWRLANESDGTYGGAIDGPSDLAVQNRGGHRRAGHPSRKHADKNDGMVTTHEGK